jgi:hypothetical protein
LVELRRCEGPRRLTQSFNIVKGPAFGEKHVHHEIHVIEQNPLTPPAALHRVRPDAEVAFEPQLDLIGNRDSLPVVDGRSDQKKIRQT